MITDPRNPFHWLLLARDRIEKADALFTQFGSSWSGVELLHEAAERFLKFWEQHYPGGDLDDVGQDSADLRQSIGQMVAIIEVALASPPQSP